MPSQLPNISRFSYGLITNRNPLDTPFSVSGMNMIVHHDALCDGLNTEVSTSDTLIRRPGFSLFASNVGPGNGEQYWKYKDLSGNLSLFSQFGGELYCGGTFVGPSSTPVNYKPWSIAPVGNFVYGTNGTQAYRLTNTLLTTPEPWGQPTPAKSPTLSFESPYSYQGTSGFLPAADSIQGVLTITNPNSSKTCTYSVNGNTMHINITVSNLPISPNQSYTETTTTSTSGTTETQTVTESTGYTATATGSSSISGGVVNYYPTQGIISLDYDYAMPNNQAASIQSTLACTGPTTYGTGSGNIPYLYLLNNPIQSFPCVEGLATSIPGGFPDTEGVALWISTFGNDGIYPNKGMIVNSGFYDITNPQYSLAITAGTLPTFHRFTSNTVNLTDLISGTFTILSHAGGATTSIPVTLSNVTIQSAVIPTSNYRYYVMQQGTTGYLVIESFLLGSVGITQDSMCSLANVSLTNETTGTPFYFTHQSTFSNSLQPQQGYKWYYAIRDTLSGGLSNLSPSVSLVAQRVAGTATIDIPTPTFNSSNSGSLQIEVYRTSDGGALPLFVGIPQYTSANGGSYTFIDSFNDSFLNPGLVGALNLENSIPPKGILGLVNHSARLWGFVGNTVYFSGGPDTLNGNGSESWPPSNTFAFSGGVQKLLSTSYGLIVFLADDIHVITGTDSASYYPKSWLSGFGILNPLAATYDGQTIYVYTCKQQLWELSEESQKEIGFNVGDIFLSSFQSQYTSLTVHRGSSTDYALYVSNGIDTIMRYGLAKGSWSPMSKPSMSCGTVASIETAIGVNTLLMGGSTIQGHLNGAALGNTFSRTPGANLDNGTAYAAYATIGTLQIAIPGTWTALEHVAANFRALGTVPTIALLNNEIAASTSTPFITLPNPVNDPPDLPASQSMFSLRWYLKAAQTPIPQMINTTQIRITFSSTDTVQNELFGIYPRASK